MSTVRVAPRPSLEQPLTRGFRLGLTTLCLASGTAIALEMLPVGEPIVVAAPMVPHKALPMPDDPKPVGSDDQALVDDVLARPLFDPRRRPPAPPPPPPPLAAVAVVKPEWTWRLAGMMSGPDGREALFMRKDEKRVVREGEMLDGWTLAAIHADNVVLDGDDGEKKLHPEPVEKTAGGNRLLAAAARNAAIAPAVIAARLNQSKAALGAAVAIKVAADTKAAAAAAAAKRAKADKR